MRFGWDAPSSESAVLGRRTDTLNRYWGLQTDALKNAFETIQATHRDSDAKGGKNEKIVARFLTSQLSPRVVNRNASVIDSTGAQSDELDVVICNSDQPYSREKLSPPLIVEGVDAVIQVKARLDTKELHRIRKNCERLKSLHKMRGSSDDESGAPTGFREAFLDFVPYFVFCFDSHLIPDTAAERYNEIFDDVHPDWRPDGIFVLNQFSILPSHEFEMTSEGVRGPEDAKPVMTGEGTLATFMYCLFTYPPRVRRRWHPASAYWNGENGEPLGLASGSGD